MSSLRQVYLTRNNGVLAAAAASLAADLERGEPTSFQAGYTPANAILAAAEIFPEVTEIEIRFLNHWERNVPDFGFAEAVQVDHLTDDEVDQVDEILDRMENR